MFGAAWVGGACEVVVGGAGKAYITGVVSSISTLFRVRAPSSSNSFSSLTLIIYLVVAS